MTERYDRYDGWAWLYNQTMGPEYGREQYALLQRALLPDVDPGADILDLCCGTGQLIQPLLDAGYHVTGLDGSEVMLKYASENAPDASYLLEDARSFDGSQQYDAVFSTSASLNHLESLDDLGAVFHNVFRALRENGTFLFDLNHPEQLKKWWRGQPTEGEIARDHAWMVTPHYSDKQAAGKFIVTIYHDPRPDGGFASRLRQPLYQLLSRPRFIGLRLKLLQAFQRVEPDWQRQDIDFPIRGHDVSEVVERLQQAGFVDIRVETIDGTELDANHSAHFICTRPSEVRQ